MSKKIFITGCAKSGTTLLLRMCFAFEDTEVLYKKGAEGHELDFNDFVDYKSTNQFVIGKRHPPALLSTTYDHQLHQTQAGKVLSEKIGIINVVRDGRDVLLSDGNYVKPERWISCIEQRDKVLFGNLIDLEISYEDLVRKPDQVQKDIENKFGLKSKHSFSVYPDYVEDWVFDWNVSVLARAGLGNEKKYGKRRVSDKAIGKDLQAYKNICTEEELPPFEKHLKHLGYL
ncbi:sulfotransferase domain-containing protein [bacterium]|jgi:hypothetical protein|nr:sulfotransferase domain-containing protein [bacterium]